MSAIQIDFTPVAILFSDDWTLLVTRNVPFRCAVEKKRSALGPSGLLGNSVNNNGLGTCCEMCGDAPNNACRS